MAASTLCQRWHRRASVVAPARRRDGHPRGCRHARDHARQARADRELDRAAEHGIALCDVIWALPVDEVEPVQPPPGHDGWFPRDGYPDMLAMPDLETARIVPWHDRTALLLCDFVDRDGRAIPLSRAPSCAPWSIAPRPWASSRSSGSSSSSTRCARRRSRCSRSARRSCRRSQERPSVYGVVAASRHEDFAGAVRATLQEYGLAVEACAPEAARASSRSTCAPRPRSRRPTRRSCSRAR